MDIPLSNKSGNLDFQLTEVVEHACGMASLQMGEYVANVANGIDTYSIREPLGVCAGICPFNFPAMIPLWVCLQYFILVSLNFIYSFLFAFAYGSMDGFLISHPHAHR
jgi:Aldehyde dehydrogenase family